MASKPAFVAALLPRQEKPTHVDVRQERRQARPGVPMAWHVGGRGPSRRRAGWGKRRSAGEEPTEFPARVLRLRCYGKGGACRLDFPGARVTHVLS